MQNNSTHNSIDDFLNQHQSSQNIVVALTHILSLSAIICSNAHVGYSQHCVYLINCILICILTVRKLYLQICISSKNINCFCNLVHLQNNYVS